VHRRDRRLEPVEAELRGGQRTGDEGTPSPDAASSAISAPTSAVTSAAESATACWEAGRQDRTSSGESGSDLSAIAPTVVVPTEEDL